MQKIFTDKVASFITNEMKICDEELTKKILLDVPENYKFFNELFEFIINLKVPYEYEDSLMSLNNGKNRKFINTELYNFLFINKLNEESKEHFIFDNIRHAFINFKQGGVLNMYQYRESEVWYPKVIIDSFLGKQEDIDELEENIIIYRGTSMDEYESHIYGQSWTLSEKVAQDFAFVYYRSQPDYANQERIVMKTTISKEIIFFYDKNGRESEVIIDISKLSNVVIIDKNIKD